MDGVSSVVACALSAGEDRLVSAAPRVLTSVVMCEQTGVDPAVVVISGAAGQGPYYRMRVGPDGCLAFSDAVALPSGLLVVCQSGEVTVSVAYR
jgi:hypothetical protein